MRLGFDIPKLLIKTERGARFVVSVTDYAIKVEVAEGSVAELHWEVADDLKTIAIAYTSRALPSLP